MRPDVRAAPPRSARHGDAAYGPPSSAPDSHRAEPTVPAPGGVDGIRGEPVPHVGGVPQGQDHRREHAGAAYRVHHSPCFVEALGQRLLEDEVPAGRSRHAGPALPGPEVARRGRPRRRPRAARRGRGGQRSRPSPPSSRRPRPACGSTRRRARCRSARRGQGRAPPRGPRVRHRSVPHAVCPRHHRAGDRVTVRRCPPSLSSQKPAATVLLVRRPPSPRRAGPRCRCSCSAAWPGMAFAGGMTVFPGGGVDPSDVPDSVPRVERAVAAGVGRAVSPATGSWPVPWCPRPSARCSRSAGCCWPPRARPGPPAHERAELVAHRSRPSRRCWPTAGLVLRSELLTVWVRLHHAPVASPKPLRHGVLRRAASPRARRPTPHHRGRPGHLVAPGRRAGALAARATSAAAAPSRPCRRSTEHPDWAAVLAAAASARCSPSIPGCAAQVTGGRRSRRTAGCTSR